MTDDDKALVERLRGDWPEILVEKHWMMDSDAIDKQREEAATRIEAQKAQIEKLRLHLDVALEVLAEEGVCGDECNTCKEARAALGETK